MSAPGLRREDSNLRDLFQRQAACHWLTPQRSRRGRTRTSGLSIIGRALGQLSYAPQTSIDPAGLEPAPHGLKGRRTAARAPGHRVKTVAEGFEPTHGRFNRAVPYQLGYATSLRGRGSGNRTRTSLYTGQALCYPFELRRKDGPGGTRTLTRSLRDFYAAVTSPALVNNCGGGNRTRDRRFMRPLLCH